MNSTLKVLLLFLLLPLSLVAQEQVSNVYFEGLYEVKRLDGEVGFAEVEGQQYMLVENGSLEIYRMENDSFVLKATITSRQCGVLNPITLDPNRSLMEIDGRKYYRIFDDGIDLIDIVDGRVIRSINYEDLGIKDYWPRERKSDRFYLQSGLKIASLDLDRMIVEILPYAANWGFVVQGDHFVRILNDSAIHVFNGLTQFDSTFYSNDVPWRWRSYSERDSSFVYLKADGSLWKLAKDYTFRKLDCPLENMETFRSLKVVGDNLVAVYESYTETMSEVVVSNLQTCETVMSFTAYYEEYNFYIEYIENEEDTSNFLICGFAGDNPIDVLSVSSYYLLDFETKSMSYVPELTRVTNGTPARDGDRIYFVGESSTYFAQTQFVLVYNGANSQTSLLNPYDYFDNKSTTIGFEVDGKIPVVTSTVDELVKVWSLSSGFAEIQSLNLLEDLGVNLIADLMSLEDRIFFTAHGGLHSVLTRSKEEFIFPNSEKIIWSFLNEPMEVAIAKYENTAGIGFSLGDSTYFFTVDERTGETTWTIFDEFKTSDNIVSFGSLLLFSDGYGNCDLRYFDLKTKSIQSQEGISYISERHLAEGDEFALYKKTEINSSVHKIFKISHLDNSFTQLDIDLEKDVALVHGFKDNFYIIEYRSWENQARITRWNSMDEADVIYDGKGRVSIDESFKYDRTDSVALFTLFSEDKEAIYLIDNLVKTDSLKLDYLSDSWSKRSILSYNRDDFILKTIDDSGNNYWFYKAFGSPINLEGPGDLNPIFTIVTDSIALLMFYSNGQLSSISHNISSGETNYREDIENINGLDYISGGMALSPSTFIVSGRSDLGFEPYLFDANTGSVSLLQDINPGTISSSPSNFLKFKDWIYFTATTDCTSKQWFRMESDFSTRTIEQINWTSDKLFLYPNPSGNEVSLKGDFDQVVVYSINGQELFTVSDYISGSVIYMETLESGTYIIHAFDSSGKLYSEKLMKVK